MFLIILTASLPLLMNMEETASRKRLVSEEMDFEQELLLLMHQSFVSPAP